MNMSVVSLASVLLGLYLLSNVDKIHHYTEKLIVWMIYRNKLNLRPIATAAYLNPEVIINSDSGTISKWHTLFASSKTYLEDGVEKNALVIELPGTSILDDASKHFDSIEVNVNAAMVEFLHYICKVRNLAVDADECGTIRAWISKTISIEMPGYWFQIELAEERLEMDLKEVEEPVLFFTLVFSIKNDKPHVKIQTGAYTKENGYMLPVEWTDSERKQSHEHQ